MDEPMIGKKKNMFRLIGNRPMGLMRTFHHAFYDGFHTFHHLLPKRG